MLLPDSPSHGSELLSSDAELAQASKPRDSSFQRFATGRIALALACALLLGVGLVAVRPQRQSVQAASSGLTQLDAVHAASVKKEVASPAHALAKDRKTLEVGTSDPTLEARLDEFEQKKSVVPRPKSSADLWPGWPCGPTEELYDSECFLSCDNITDGALPFRAEPCKCCKNSTCLLSPPPPDAESAIDCKRFDKAADGRGAHQPMLPDCPYEDEEIFEGLCYTRCSLLTMGKYPIRTAMNTCANHDYGGEWSLGFGPCSGFGIGGTKCLPHQPKAFGAGFDQPNRRPGIGPFGFTVLKLPEVPEEFAPPS